MVCFYHVGTTIILETLSLLGSIYTNSFGILELYYLDSQTCFLLKYDVLQFTKLVVESCILLPP